MTLYKISNIVQQTEKVRVIQLECLQGKKISFTPGQFVNISFTNDSKQSELNEWKSFSISSSPFEEKILELVVLDLGNFRHFLYNAKIGTIVNVNGPHGTFVYHQDADSFPVFLAGGSGIAPIMSMLRYVNQKYPGTQSTLFYTFKSEKDIIFLKELKEIKKSNKMFQCHFVATRDTENIFCRNNNNAQLITDRKIRDNILDYHKDLAEEDIQWKSGHIDESMIARNIKEVSSGAYYICGPYEMMIMVSYILQKLGVDNSSIKSELW